MAGLGELLAELRKDKKMTLQEVGDVLFVTAQTISNYEHGHSYPSYDALIVLADLYEVTLDYLLGRTRVPLPIDVYNEPILNNKTAGQLIAEIRSLSPARKQALATMLDDMRIGTVIDQT